jgi:hypothetical protein
MHSSFNHSLMARFPDPVLALRRDRLVTGLFTCSAEIQEIEGGYVVKFRRSELLVRRITEYIVFEGQHSPQPTFSLVSEPNGGVSWFQVGGLEGEKKHS